VILDINPISVWSSSGIKQANRFEVCYIQYMNGGVSAQCRILKDNIEVISQIVTATPDQTSTWTDDLSFYKVLAQNAGLIPSEVQVSPTAPLAPVGP
jgi:hypothetical protein